MRGADERQALDASSPWWGEHVARYQFALPLVRERATLDVACGTGLGLAILQTQASRVVGVDGDDAAVLSARRAAPTATVLQADALALPFADESFAAVTTFETIEHLQNRAQFLREIVRVLSKDGVCVLSTPNAHYTKPVAGKPRNPFHVHEYEPSELVSELEPFFSSIKIFGQVLNSRFVVPPFWDDQQRLPRTLWNQLGLTLRRIGNRMPARARDVMSEKLWGHRFFPVPSDYAFLESEVAEAPVSVVICREPRKP